MNYFNKYRVVFWIMILMIAINISGLTSFYFYYKANKTTVADTASCNATCRFLDEQLAMSTAQSVKVSEINKKFREKTEPVVTEIKNIRTALLDELTSEKTDTAKLNQYTEKIGELQKQLQKAAIVQFQQLKQICTPSQCLKLSDIFSEVYCCRKTGQEEGKKMQQQSHKKQCCSDSGNMH